MKTTTMRGATVEVVVTRFEQGDDWARFEVRSDRPGVVLYTRSGSSDRLELTVDAAAAQMSALRAGRWDVDTQTATLPAWAA